VGHFKTDPTETVALCFGYLATSSHYYPPWCLDAKVTVLFSISGHGWNRVSLTALTAAALTSNNLMALVEVCMIFYLPVLDQSGKTRGTIRII
jgi:hypothetical protein